MAFFQNPFFEDYTGSWVLGDRQQSLSYPVKGNQGRSADMVYAFNKGTVNYTPPAYSPVTWAAGTAFYQNQWVGPISGYYYFCSAAGTSGTTAPAWASATTLNSTVTDNTVTWTNMGTVAPLSVSTTNATPSALVLGNKPYPSYGNELAYNLSGNDSNGTTNGRKLLTINFAYKNFNQYVSYAIDLTSTAASAATVFADDMVNALNADAVFSTYFTAANKEGRLVISSLKPGQTHFYIQNSGAEEILGFNQRASYGDIPTYFARDTALNVLNYNNSSGSLVQLSFKIPAASISAGATSTITCPNNLTAGTNVVIAQTVSGTTTLFGPTPVTGTPSSTSFQVGVNIPGTYAYAFWARAIDANFIAQSTLGVTLANGQDDWKLLKGRSGLFQFQSSTFDGNSPPRPLVTLTYPAGAIAGDLAMKTVNNYANSGTGSTPTWQAQVPYTLTAADINTIANANIGT